MQVILHFSSTFAMCRFIGFSNVNRLFKTYKRYTSFFLDFAVVRQKRHATNLGVSLLHYSQTITQLVASVCRAYSVAYKLKVDDKTQTFSKPVLVSSARIFKFPSHNNSVGCSSTCWWVITLDKKKKTGTQAPFSQLCNTPTHKQKRNAISHYSFYTSAASVVVLNGISSPKWSLALCI